MADFGSSNPLLGDATPKPKSRELMGGMFGQVADAFDGKSLGLGEEESGYEKRQRKQAEAEMMSEKHSKQ